MNDDPDAVPLNCNCIACMEERGYKVPEEYQPSGLTGREIMIRFWLYAAVIAIITAPIWVLW